MKHFVMGSDSATLASLGTILETAGAHNWSPIAIEAYMRAEAKKLRGNVWYYLSRCVPLKQFTIEERLATFFFSLFGVCIVMAVVGYKFIIPELSIAATVFFIILTFLAFSDWKVLVRSPGQWKTEAFSNKHRLITSPEALAVFKNTESLLQGAQFEISLLYQDKKLCDPVLWLRLDIDGSVIRRPLIVWDKDGETVLPA